MFLVKRANKVQWIADDDRMHEDLTDLMANALVALGSRHSFVVHGMDGLDEITLTDRSKVSEGKNGRGS